MMALFALSTRTYINAPCPSPSIITKPMAFVLGICCGCPQQASLIRLSHLILLFLFRVKEWLKLEVNLAGKYSLDVSLLINLL
jgi:hypothetical protein